LPEIYSKDLIKVIFKLLYRKWSQLGKAGLGNIKTVCGYAFLKASKWERSLKTKASKSFDLEALKLAAPGIRTSNQIMQDWTELGGV
jgi:hypothetical protein